MTLYPGDQRSLANLAAAHIKAGKYAEAKDQLEQILLQEPNHREALSNLGAIYQINNSGFTDLGKAEELYQRGLKADPNHLKVVLNMGLLYLSTNRLPEARDYFNRALLLNPRSEAAMDGLRKIDQALRTRGY